MYLRDLKKVNSIDAEIAALHKDLLKLYHKRTQLVTQQPLVRTVLDSRVLYDQLATSWAKHDVKLPTYRSLQTKLEKAQVSLHTLPDFNRPTIVLVPPFSTLKAVLQQPRAAQTIHFSDDTLLNNLKKSSKWTVMVLDTNQLISVEESMVAQNEGRYSSLGVQELLAASLQGVPIEQNEGWILLIKDMSDNHLIPCVSVMNQQLNFDVDDYACLLGQNYVIPAFQVA